jgi:cell division protein FtsB
MARAGRLLSLVRTVSIRTVLFALGVIYIGVNLFIGQQGLISWRENAERAAELTAQLDALRTHKSALEARLALLDPAGLDADYVEELAARDLMMTRPGDIVVVLPPAAPAQ